MKKFVLRLLVDTEGQDLVEYALLAALLGLAATTVMSGVQGAVNAKFAALSGHLGP